MELAARELGISSVTSLRFRGGTGARSAGPSSSPALADTPERVLIERIAGRMAELRADVVLTHSSYGDYGHPDHALTHRLVVQAAAEAAPDAEVYALAWPRRVIRLNALMMRLGLRFRNDRGDATHFDLAAALKTAPPVTRTVDVTRFLPQRKRAAKHYAKEISQGPLPMRLMEAMPPWGQRFLLGKARLSRVR
jgi:LmbE family N-acetylglucosaminyl deacetylase